MPEFVPSTVTFDHCGTPNDLLHRLVREEMPGLVRALGEHGRSLPRYALSELERFGACGDSAVGFAHLYCEDCQHHRIVPFTCHTRGFCPCCCGRRMAERAATWCDQVIPYVPVRQWVLTIPRPRRFLFARRPEVAGGTPEWGFWALLATQRLSRRADIGLRFAPGPG